MCTVLLCEGSLTGWSDGLLLENVDKENFRGDGDRHFPAFPSHPLLLQYLSAKQTAWLHLQRVIFCLCHINRQHNPTPPPTPAPTNPHNTAPPCFCLSAKHGDSSSDGRKKNFSDMYKMQMCVLEERRARAHTQADANAHTHTTQPEQLVCGRDVSPTTQRTQM